MAVVLELDQICLTSGREITYKLLLMCSRHFDAVEIFSFALGLVHIVILKIGFLSVISKTVRTAKS